MKFNYRFGAAGAAMVAMLGMASAAQAAPVTASAEARAEIVKALTVVKETDLDFGKIAVSGAAGSMTVDPDGTASNCAAALTCYSTTSGAKFNVETGSAGKTLTVELPTDVLLVRAGAASTGADGAGNPLYDTDDTLELSSYTTDADANPILAADGVTVIGTAYSVDLVDDGTGSGNGVASFSVGGTLSFDGTEAEGAYSATISVEVDYS